MLKPSQEIAKSLAVCIPNVSEEPQSDRRSESGPPAESESRPTQVPRYTHQSLQTRPMEDAARHQAVRAENDRRHAAISGIIREGVLGTQLPVDQEGMFRGDGFPDLKNLAVPDSMTAIGQKNKVANWMGKRHESGPFQHTSVGSIVGQNQGVMQGRRGTDAELMFQQSQPDALPSVFGMHHPVEKIADAAPLPREKNLLVGQTPDGDDLAVFLPDGYLEIGEVPAPFPEVSAFMVETQPGTLRAQTGQVAQRFVVPQSICRAERQARHLQPARRQDSTG